MRPAVTYLAKAEYDNGPIEFQSTMFGTFHVWRENKELDIYTSKGHLDQEARWGFGETPEEAAKDLFRELALKDTEIGPKPEKFYTAEQPTGTVIRIKGGSIDPDTHPRGWVYEKLDANCWSTTYLAEDYADETVQQQADEHGFDIIYTPEGQGK